MSKDRGIKSALITGGAGFIGSHLARALVAQKVPVRILDNLSSGHEANLEGLGRQIEFVSGDVRNALACRNACRDIDVVFHLAALVSVPQSIADPISAEAVNSGGTLNLLLAARDSGVRRMVFSSSAAVYGDTAVLPTHEDVLPRPLSPYGIQKLTGEHYCRLFTQLFSLETVCLRYFNVYGARQNPRSAYAAAVPLFLTALLSGNAPTVFGDGEQTRDFCAVEDVAEANILAATVTHPDVAGSIFNIAGGQRTSINVLLDRMRSVTGADLPIHYAEARLGDIRHSAADISRARAILGYGANVELTEGLRRAAAYYRSL